MLTVFQTAKANFELVYGRNGFATEKHGSSDSHASLLALKKSWKRVWTSSGDNSSTAWTNKAERVTWTSDRSHAVVDDAGRRGHMKRSYSKKTLAARDASVCFVENSKTSTPPSGHVDFFR